MMDRAMMGKAMRAVTDGDKGKAPQVPDDLWNLSSYLIRLIQIGSYKQFETKTQGFGSAPRYYGLLRIVEANPGLPQTQLARMIHLDRSSVVPILEKLENEGVVVRRNSENDKRIRRIFITERGRGVLADLKNLVEKHEVELVSSLAAAERKTLVRLLQKVADNMFPQSSHEKV